MSLINKIFMLLLVLTFAGCNDPVVDIEDFEYIPKIVVEGFIYPGEKIDNIKIMRNFKVTNKADSTILFLTPADNNVEAFINDIKLKFNPVTKYYYSDELIPDYETAYHLEIKASFDNINLKTTAFTVTPNKGFKFYQNDLGEIDYKSSDIYLKFKRSKRENEFYVFSIVAENASENNFIYDNEYFPGYDKLDVIDELPSLAYNSEDIRIPFTTKEDTVSFLLDKQNLLFSTSYRIIGYAGDKNFKDYFYTVDNMLQLDGNYIKPIMHFTNDGIGIFGSAVKDKLTLRIVNN